MHRRFATVHGEQSWRGDPEAYGRSVAILLGDLTLVWSDELLQSGGLDPAVVARGRPVFDEMRTEVTAGQYLDVLGQAGGDGSGEWAGPVAPDKSAKDTIGRPLPFGAAPAG